MAEIRSWSCPGCASMGAPIDGCRDSWHHVQPGQTWSTATTINPMDLAAENARLRQDRDSWRLVAERLQREINEATEAMTALAPCGVTGRGNATDHVYAKPAPAEPAGLDAAIEAAKAVRYGERVDDYTWDIVVEKAVRAAAPHLWAAALNEAAGAAVEHHHYQSCALDVSAWLRERAGREST